MSAIELSFLTLFGSLKIFLKMIKYRRSEISLTSFPKKLSPILCCSSLNQMKSQKDKLVKCREILVIELELLKNSINIYMSTTSIQETGTFRFRYALVSSGKKVDHTLKHSRMLMAKLEKICSCSQRNKVLRNTQLFHFMVPIY